MATGSRADLFRAVGLMSGTSLDGVDVAVIETDGAEVVRTGIAGFLPYTDEDRTLLRRALAEAAGLTDRSSRPGVLGEAERRVTRRHVEAVRHVLDEHGIALESVDVVGFHGQTVLHRPEDALTVQIGDGAVLAGQLGVDVVADLRAADVAAGGQGAPLVPVFHRALAEAAKLPRPAVLLNVGGVANVTFLPAEGDPTACDTGPGNALLDDLMLERTGLPIDRDGSTAARGRVDEQILVGMLAHPFFDRPAPKSLDRNAFSREPVAGLDTADAAATLTAFTAASVARALPHLPAQPLEVVVCGGGARNPTLLAHLARYLSCPVTTAERYGWTADAIEAQAFAYLAVRSLLALPLTFPTTTGGGRSVTGGVLHRGR